MEQTQVTDPDIEGIREALGRDAILEQVFHGAKSVGALASRVNLTQGAFARALNAAFTQKMLTQWGSGIELTDKGRRWAISQEAFKERIAKSMAEFGEASQVVRKYQLRRLYSEVRARGAAVRVLDQPVDDYLSARKANGEISGFGYQHGRYFLWVSREADAHEYPRAINTTPVRIMRSDSPSLASLTV